MFLSISESREMEKNEKNCLFHGAKHEVIKPFLAPSRKLFEYDYITLKVFWIEQWAD